MCDKTDSKSKEIKELIVRLFFPNRLFCRGIFATPRFCFVLLCFNLINDACKKKTVWQFNSKNYSYKSFHRVQQKVLLLINLPQNTRHGPTCCNHQDKTKKLIR